MRRLILYIFISTTLISCLSSDQKVSDANVFNLAVFLGELKSNDWNYNNVKLISDNGILRDTVVFENFSIDSILPLIKSFDYSKKERAGEFDVKSFLDDGLSCTTFRYVGDSEIEYLSLCKKNNQVVRIAGKKKNNSLLGFLQQSYQLNVDHQFELNSTFIDKVSSDTLTTTSKMYWNLIK